MLRYVGKGKAIIGIPARDLSDEEVEKYGGEEELIATGLYEKGEKAMKVHYENKSMMKEDDHARD